MNRSLHSRLQQFHAFSSNGAKRKRQAESAEVTEKRLRKAREHKKATQRADAERLEANASQARLNQVASTEARNQENQVKISKHIKSDSDEFRFFAEIDEPLSKICGVCGELVALNAVKLVPYKSSDRRFQILAVTTPSDCNRGLVEAGVTRQDGVEQVAMCTRCERALSQNQVPRYSIASGFDLKPIPNCLMVLNPMEARMIGLGVCFTTCFCLGHLGQSATRGNSINFWNNAADVVSKLPRPASKCGVVRLKKPGATSLDTYYNVRPWLLREALVWLRKNNPIYGHITIDEELLTTMSHAGEVLSIELAVDEPDNYLVGDDDESLATAHSTETFDESFVLEHEFETQLEEESILEHLHGHNEDQAYVTAPLDRPMSEYSTKLLMQCCFPTLFPHGHGGYHPIENVETRLHDVKLADYCCHLMSWHDRRFVTHPTFKFFCLNFIQRRQIDGLIQRVHCSGKSGEPECSSSKQNENPASTSKPQKHNVAKYLKDLRPFFRSVRGTGLYWANVRDDVMSMIGNPAMENRWPTFFVTLSAADTVWPDFFRVCNPLLTFEEAGMLSPAQRRKYLNENPDLAARHFHRRFQSFFRHILCGKSKPLGEILDFFWRIEFQRRGSPHVHALLWIEGAPDIIELSKTPEGIAQLGVFADRFVSCMRHQQQHQEVDGQMDPVCLRPPSVQSPKRLEDLGALVERVQLHVCSSRSSCQRNGKCRFDFPKELKETTSVVRVVSHGGIRIRFEHKRDDEATNNYNPTMLSTWRANMDVKIIGNAYGAAEYTAAYVSKAEPDSVRFRKSIEASLNKIPDGVPYQRLLQRTANAMLAIREVSAQEAVYILSKTLCLYGKSRGVLKVKVSRHDRRYYQVQPKPDGSFVPTAPTSNGIRIEPIEQAYMQRPTTDFFVQLSYREFCEAYEVSAADPKPGQRLQRWKRRDGRGYIKARLKKQIVRPSPRYSMNEDDADYCYAQLFLYKPWRLLSDLPCDDGEICASYTAWKNQGTSPWINHIQESIQREKIIEATQTEDIALPAPMWSFSVEEDIVVVSDNVLHEDASQELQAFVPRLVYSSETIGLARRFIQDVVRPFAKSEKPKDGERHERYPYAYPTEDQSPSMSSDQWRPFSIWMRQSRLRSAAMSQLQPCAQVQMVVSGEGGTGKSWLIQQIIQDIRVVFGEDGIKKHLLRMAHQGSAAHLIGGRTLTSALALPSQGGVSFRRDYIPLQSTNGGSATLRRLQMDYDLVHLIVVDEFGVISCGMIHWIDQRLREIFVNHQHLPFGGRDILFTGDPGQLGPISSSPLSTPVYQLTHSSEIRGRKTWESIPTYFVLRQQNRGLIDPEWYDTLRRIREGDASEDDVELINSRVAQPPLSNTSDVVYVAYRNVDVDEANEVAIRRLRRPICTARAHHEATLRDPTPAHPPLDENTRRELIKEARSISTPSAKYLPLQLELALGAPVALTYNMEQRAGLCNGSTGIVHDIILDDETPRHQPIVLVKMRDYKGPSFLPNITGVVPVTTRTAVLTSKKDGPYRLSRTALPLRLGFATTIHKIQGRTCEAVVFNPTALKDSALAYVALSRVRRRDDMFLSTPLTLNQLRKSDRARTLDETEDCRVAIKESQANNMAAQLIASMKTIANMHNQRTVISI